MSPELLIAGFIAGLVGSTHCLGMCGGISASLGAATGGARSLPLILGFNVGRVGSYALAGAGVALIGGLGMAFAVPGWSLGLRLLAGALMIAIGAQVLSGRNLLAPLERLGMRFWQRIAPAARALMPVRSLPAALGLGMLWGWLPCGLVYGALMLAASAGHVLGGAATMLAFGTGTLPAMVMTTFAGARTRNATGPPRWRQLAAVAVIATGVVTILGPAGVMPGHAP